MGEETAILLFLPQDILRRRCLTRQLFQFLSLVEPHCLFSQMFSPAYLTGSTSGIAGI